MADLIDVSDALVALIAQTVFPNGTAQPAIVPQGVKIYPGWPQPAALDADLTIGNVNISVFPQNGERVTTRYFRREQIIQAAAPTLTITVNGQVMTIGGTVSTPQNVAVNINGTPYVYAVQPSDTLTSIATALAALSGSSSTGAAITFGATSRILSARVGAVAKTATELKRQEKVFQITIWASTPDVRDSLAAPIDTALAGTEFLNLPDGFGARLIYRSSFQDDALQKSNLFRRDLNYSVEWATTRASNAPQVITTVTQVAPPNTTPTTTYQ
jgi:hypothetical protein